MPEFSSAWLALIGAILGGSGLKFVEHFLQREKVRQDTATAFRDELRQEMNMLRAELRVAETDLDSWRGRYYDLLDKSTREKIENAEALHKVQEAADANQYSEHTNAEKREIQDARDTAAEKLRERDA